MKKLFAILLTLLLLASLMACGKDKAPATPEEVKGTVYDTGVFTVLVPDGWLAVPGPDIFDDYEGDEDPYQLSIYKGAESEWDAFSTPGVTIIFHEPDEEISDQSWFYDNVETLAPITTGDYTWDAFTGESIGDPIAVLTTHSPSVVQVNFTLEVNKKAITLEDAEVIAILQSIAAK